MDTSYQNIDRAHRLGIFSQPATSQSINKEEYLLIALGIITLIGSLVATGCLYSQLGYASFAIGGTGIVLGIFSFLLSKYSCVANGSEEDILYTLTKSAKKEGDAYLIDFSKVNPSNIFNIFDKGSTHSGLYGDVRLTDKIYFDESEKFVHNFPYKYGISIVTLEKNDHGFNTLSSYTFTMNDEGMVESYGKVFDNFDAYLACRMKRIYSGGYLTFEHFDFQSVPTNNGCIKLRKKPLTTNTEVELS